MERMRDLTNFLQEQGYSLLPSPNAADFNMYRPINPNPHRSYPRFHFHIQLVEEQQLLIETANLYFHPRPHRTPLTLGHVREITARERLRLHQALWETSNIEPIFKAKLLSRLNHLLLFDSAEGLGRFRRNGGTMTESFFEAAKQRKGAWHHKYVRDNYSWKLEVLEDLLSV